MILSVFNDRSHIIQTDTGRIMVPVFESPEIIFLPVEPVKPVDGSNPEIVVTVLIYATDIIIAQTISVGRIIPVNLDFISVIPVESVAGTKPDKSQAVLKNGFNRA